MPMKSPWPVRTGSLVLRDVRDEEIERLLTIRNNPSANKFMFRTFVEPETFRMEWLTVADSEDDFSCVAECNGEVVGMGYLEIVDGMGQPGMPKRTEAVLAYVIEPVHWGKGFGTSLAKGLLETAFDHIGVRRVTAKCNADNLASVRILESLGMRREQHGVADSWHADFGWIDGYQYAMLREEWKVRRSFDQ